MIPASTLRIDAVPAAGSGFAGCTSLTPIGTRAHRTKGTAKSHALPSPHKGIGGCTATRASILDGLWQVR
jgi:hypothetical protein